MDFQFLFRVIWRRKWLMVLAGIIAAATTFTAIHLKERIYKASAILSTGMVDYKGLDPEEGLPFLQQFQIDINYNNLIRFIQSKPNMELLSYRLVLHDLKAIRQGGNSFREPEFEDVESIPFSDAQIDELIKALTANLDSLKTSFSQPALQKQFEKIAEALGYDRENMLKYNLRVGRLGATDYLNMEFVSENPELCAYAVNNFCDDFLRKRKKLQNSDVFKKVEFLSEMVKQKKDLYERKKLELKNYRESLELIDLPSQQEVIVGQIKELELNLEEERKRIPALKKNIINLNTYLNKKGLDDQSTEDLQRITNNKDLINVNAQIVEKNNELVDFIMLGATDELLNIKNLEIEELESRRDELIQYLASDVDTESDSKALEDTEKELFITRVRKEMELNEAEQSVKSYEQEIQRLKTRALGFVSAEAYTQRVQDEISFAQNEYEDLLGSLNQAQVELQKSYQPLTILEEAEVPEKSEPTKKMLFSVFAGIVAGGGTLFLILFFALIDNSLHTPTQFKNLVSLPYLGKVAEVNTRQLDIKELFHTDEQNKVMEAFRENLRALRYQIERSGGQTFLFTSNKAGEGKTFMMLVLAYSLRMKGKKVLVIDTNFKNNELSRMTLVDQNNSSQKHRKLIGQNQLSTELVAQHIYPAFNLDELDIIGNPGSYRSPDEIFAGKDFEKLLSDLAKKYDYIFMEAAALNQYSDTQELVPYVDKVIAVFMAASKIKASDKLSLQYLKNLKGKLLGAVHNKVDYSNLNN